MLPVREAISPSWERDSHVNEINQEHLELMFGEWPWPGGAGVGWSNEPQRVERWTQSPSFDELLEQLRENET